MKKSQEYHLQFPNKAIKIFIILCIAWWIFGIATLSLYGTTLPFKWINTHHNTTLDIIMPLVTRFGEFFMIFIIGILMLIIIKRYHLNFTRLLLLAILCNSIPALINLILKNIFAQHRPLYYFENEDWLHFIPDQPKQYHLSFPSGHTEGVFALMTFIVLILPSKYKLTSIFFFLLAMATGYSRIYLSQHFFEDILAGSMIGTIFCILTYNILILFRKHKI